MKTPTLFSLNLKRTIERKQLKVEEVARDMEISRAYLYQLMNGEREPSTETIAAACSVLGVTRGDLFEDETVLAEQSKERFTTFHHASVLLRAFEAAEPHLQASVLALLTDDESYLEKFPEAAAIFETLS